MLPISDNTLTFSGGWFRDYVLGLPSNHRSPTIRLTCNTVTPVFSKINNKNNNLEIIIY